MLVEYARMDVVMEHVYNKMTEQKRGMSGMVWILIILILIALGVVGYFLFISDGGSSILGGSSIPQPPALPS